MKKSKEPRVKQPSILNAQISIYTKTAKLCKKCAAQGEKDMKSRVAAKK